MLPLPDGCAQPLLSAVTGALRSLHREWERLRELARFPLFGYIKWSDRPRLIEMEHCVELVGQLRAEIVALALGFRTVDPTDRALEPGRAQLLRQRLAVVEDN